MRVEQSPDYAADFLVVHLASTEDKSLESGWRISDDTFVEDLSLRLSLNVNLLSHFGGETEDESEEILAAGRPLAEYASADFGGSLSIYIPDEWIPKKYFTRIPVTINGDVANELPPKGVLLIFERDEDEHMYALFPKPEK